MGGGLRGAAAKKELGAFYTPDSTASSLAGWAIRTGTESVLEPSVGGGALLKAALIQAREIKPFGGLRQPLACDIDPIALETLRNELGKTVEFCLGDFLELDPRKFRKFDVVFANPPFTRNHSIDVYRRKELRERFGIEGPAGIWTYFLAHAMDFLVQVGGSLQSSLDQHCLHDMAMLSCGACVDLFWP